MRGYFVLNVYNYFSKRRNASDFQYKLNRIVCYRFDRRWYFHASYYVFLILRIGDKHHS